MNFYLVDWPWFSQLVDRHGRCFYWLVEGRGWLFFVFLGPSPIWGMNHVFGEYLLTERGVNGVWSSLEAQILPLSIPSCFLKQPCFLWEVWRKSPKPQGKSSVSSLRVLDRTDGWEVHPLHLLLCHSSILLIFYVCKIFVFQVKTLDSSLSYDSVSHPCSIVSKPRE